MYIALPIGKNILIANDVPESMSRLNKNVNRSKIAITAENRDEANRLFNGLSAGGILMFLLATFFMALLLECLETNLVLNRT